MSILEALKFSTGDADKDAQIRRGLLMAGLQLMQARGSLMPAIGQAGMTGLQAADMTRQSQQARDRAAMEAQMRKLQLGQAQRQERIDALPQQFYRPPSMPAVDATGGMETAVEAPNNASGPGGMDTDGLMRAYMGMGAIPQAAQLRAFMQKPEVQPLVSKPGDVARDPKTGAILWQNPEAADGEKDAFLRVMKAAGIDPASEQGKRMLASYLTKQSTHPAPVAIHNAPYAPVMTVEGPNGPMAIQPGSRPGQAPGVVINPVTGKPAVPFKAEPNMTEGQAKANLFGTRAQEANKIIAALSAQGVQSPSLAQQATGGEGMAGALATAFATPQQQQVDQAQRDFINATLRRESGAVISPQEFTNARKQYFVMPGDSPQVIAQKARNREIAIAGMLAEVPENKRGAGIPAAGASAPDSDPLGLRRK